MSERDPYPARCTETDADGVRCMRGRRHTESRLDREKLHDFGKGAVGLRTLGPGQGPRGPVIT